MTASVFAEIYRVVKKIPRGKIMTYGEIAQKIKNQNAKVKITSQNLKVTARIVGWALHANKNENIPCHRVVDRNGAVAQNYAFGGWREQRRRLMGEGMRFKDEKCVDLKAIRN